jgi:glycine/D-amino acid oxidase-like deaminating enzyme
MTANASLPSSVPTLVIGAGVHGLSTAWHLAKQGERVLVVDKTDVAAGASGIACGIVRNNYFQPAMQELMAACVDVWESEPEKLHYHPNGYIALGPAAQEGDLTAVYERQQRIGYPSKLYLGEEEVSRHMRSLYDDWRAPGLTVCLHEQAGGYAFNKESIRGLAELARAAGAQIVTGVEVTGVNFDDSGAVTNVQTSAGTIAVERVVVAVGPWIASLWQMLGLPDRIDVRQPDGTIVTDQPMWTYWYLQEGEAEFDPAAFTTNDGKSSPVLHVDSDQPLHADDGELITDQSWGVYFKPDRDSVQGGAQPIKLGNSFQVDPYPTGTVDSGFPGMWSASLSHCLGRFQGARERYRQTRSGGVGAFTVDNFPVLDFMHPNVFVAADSNHGYKMIAIGREIARVLGGEHSSLLHPFRYERFEPGDLHPVSNSPYPWS